MSVNLTNTLYNSEFVENLLKQVEDKIALLSNKDYKNAIYNLAASNITGYSDLLTCRDILEKVLKCHTCFVGCHEPRIEDIIQIVKSKINNC